MFAIMPQTSPTFSFGRTGPGQSYHRPAFSSPLSSSPVRASSASPPPYQRNQPQNQQQTISQPLSPCGPNFLNTLPRNRQIQSSPIFPSGTFSPNDQNCTSAAGSNSNTPKFRFASRNPRPNPVLKRREDAQEGRRRLFFQNVRQRQEDRKWEMRGGEDELLKLEWHRLNRERQQAKEAELTQSLGGPMLDADVAAREEEELRMMREVAHYRDSDDMDALMADAIARQEEAEMEALVEALEGDGHGYGQQQHFSDDENYDGLFMDLIHQQQQQHGGGQGMGYEQDVEMS